MFTANSDSGTYAEYTLSKFGFTFKLDDHFNFEEGSAIGVPYFTVLNNLFYNYYGLLNINNILFTVFRPIEHFS